jgi:hypothetical protein
MTGTVIKAAKLSNGGTCEFSYPLHIFQSVNSDYTIAHESHYFDYDALKEQLEYCNDLHNLKDGGRKTLSNLLPDLPKAWQDDMG